MNKPTRRLLFWLPRVFCILFAVFAGLFALDVFGQGYGFLDTVLALLIHLVPTWIVLVALIISWRWEWVGGVTFIALGVLYLVMFRGRVIWAAYLAIAGLLFLLGVLFFIGWFHRKEIRANP